jgi:enterobactin synthetase component D
MECQVNNLFSLKNAFSYHFVSFSVSSYSGVSSYQSHHIAFPEHLRCAVPKRQAEFLAGRLCAAKALSRLGFNYFQVGQGEGRQPLWPDGLCGSISHSADMAVAIVSNAPHFAGIGVDLEQVISEHQARVLHDKVIYPKECVSFNTLAKLHDHAFTIVFSAKESIFKALYPSVGAFFGFEAAALVDCNQNTLVFCLTKCLSRSLPAGKLLTVDFQQANAMILTECLFEHK